LSDDESELFILRVKKGVPTNAIDKKDLASAPFDELIIFGFRAMVTFGEAQNFSQLPHVQPSNAIMKLSIYCTGYHVNWAADAVMGLMDTEPRLMEAVWNMMLKRRGIMT
jgi:hypothetical protein